MTQTKYAIPPRGWNSFDYYDACVSEEEMLNNATVLADKFLAYGYEYAVIDIQWYAHDTGTRRDEYEYIPFSTLEMDEYGRLMPDPAKFPSAANGAGFKPLADKIHAMGLKFGIHIMRGIPRTAAEQKLPVLGTSTTADEIANAYSICNWNPDMYGVKNTADGQKYYDSLIELYCDWGVDFIKCDDICYTAIYPGHADAGFDEIIMLERAIRKSGRDIVLSVSPGPAIIEQGNFYQKHTTMWRLSGDFWDNWQQLRDMFDLCEQWQVYSSEGRYPDCDMLPFGIIGGRFPGGERKTNFTKAEQESVMTLWGMIHSPLMIGADLTRLDADTERVLTNPDILQMDSCAYTGRQVVKNDKHAVWESSSKDGDDIYIAMFNFKDVPVTVTAGELCCIDNVSRQYSLIRDVWKGTEINVEDVIEIAPHGTALVHFA